MPRISDTLAMLGCVHWVEGQLEADAQRLAERNAYWAEVRNEL